MRKLKENPNFALHYLYKRGRNIKVNEKYTKENDKPSGKWIAKHDNFPDEYLKPLEEAWFIGKPLVTELANIETIGLDDLKEKNHTVVMKWIRGKRVMTIQPMRRDYGDFHEATMDQIRSYQIKFDPGTNSVKLTGPDAGKEVGLEIKKGETEWIPVEPQKKKEAETDRFGVPIMEKDSFMIDMLEAQGEEIEEKPEFFVINNEHIAVLITNDGKILCISKTSDIQKIGFAGKTGYGKSVGMHSITDRIDHKWKDNIIILNDSLNQFHALHQPTDFKKLMFLFDGSKDVVEDLVQPRPLPILNLYLACQEVKHQWKGIDFNYYVSYFEYLNKFGYFTYGIEKYKIKGTERYLSSVKQDLLECKNKEEIKDKLFQLLDPEKYSAMIMKWADAFDGIFNEKFLNHLYDADTEWTDKNGYKDDPIFVCIKNGIIPVLNTSFIKTHVSFPNIMGNLINKIIRYQQKNRERTWVLVDEIPDIYKVGRRKDNASEALEELFRQGRINNIGFIYTIQSYDDLHDDIRANTSHLFVSLIKRDKERKMIAKDYHLTSQMEKKLAKMKRFEFMCMTDEPMIEYDIEGNHTTVDGGVWIGTCLAPLSRHIAPARIEDE